jgi:hypothetical protein
MLLCPVRILAVVAALMSAAACGYSDACSCFGEGIISDGATTMDARSDVSEAGDAGHAADVGPPVDDASETGNVQSDATSETGNVQPDATSDVSPPGDAGDVG